MPEDVVHTIALGRALQALKILGYQFHIVAPDGSEYGEPIDPPFKTDISG